MYTQPPEASVAPKCCPFCNSVDITTTSKEVNAATYWLHIVRPDLERRPTVARMAQAIRPVQLNRRHCH
jgi:hypothetical protein